jgi:hypothetical protein
MTKSRRRSTTAAGRAQRDIERLLWLERLHGATIPVVLAAGALLTWVLGASGAVPPALAVLVAGSSLLLLCLFFGLREFVDDATGAWRALLLAAFAVAFAALTVDPLAGALYPPPDVAAAELGAPGSAFAVPTRDTAVQYRVVVEGHVPVSTERLSQSQNYRLRVDRDGAAPQLLEGDFSDRWSMRRLGRRGTAPVHVVRSSAQHSIDVGPGEEVRVSLEELAPPTAAGVSVRVHPEAVRSWLLVGSGILLVSVAAAIDACASPRARG